MGVKINLKLTMYKDDVLQCFYSFMFYAFIFILALSYLVLEILIFRYIHSSYLYLLPFNFLCEQDGFADLNVYSSGFI